MTSTRTAAGAPADCAEADVSASSAAADASDFLGVPDFLAVLDVLEPDEDFGFLADAPLLDAADDLDFGLARVFDASDVAFGPNIQVVKGDLEVLDVFDGLAVLDDLDDLDDLEFADDFEAAVDLLPAADPPVLDFPVPDFPAADLPDPAGFPLPRDPVLPPAVAKPIS
jgi:hypothetical protein